MQLVVVAYDLGQPVPYETMQPLQVALSDIDDNEPVFLKPPVMFLNIRYFTIFQVQTIGQLASLVLTL